MTDEKKEKETPKTKDEKTEEKTVAVLIKLVEDLAGRITSLQSGMNLKIGNLKRDVDLLKGKVPDVVDDPGAKEADNEGIPEDILKAVQDKLGKTVKVEIEDLKDQPAYRLKLHIPKHLSKNDGPDVRSKVIRNSEGIPVIKEWLEIIKMNIFNSFKQAGESVPQF